MNPALLHPVINHFTIALITASFILDLFGVFTKKAKFHTAAWYNLLLGGIAGVLTVVTGLIAEENVSHGKAAHEIMEIHETLAFIILGLVLVLLTWRIIRKGIFPEKAPTIYILAGLLTVILIFVNGYLGGELVFKHGVAVEAAQDPGSSDQSENGETRPHGDQFESEPHSHDN